MRGPFAKQTPAAADAAEIAALRRTLEELTERQVDIVMRLEDIGRELVAAREERAAQRGEHDELARRLAAAQAMIGRTYEQAQHWPERVGTLRATPEYGAAWEPNPLVSITIPTYNRGELLCERSLASVRRQTYENWQAIVIGDCCTDDTAERVAALGDPRIRYENLPVRGPYPDDPREGILVYGAAAAERARSLVEGQWVAQIDDDDEWDDDHLEVLLDAAVRSRAEIVYGKWRQRDASNGRVFARDFGEWPLRIEQFAFQAAIYHAGLAPLGHDTNTRFSGEPGDWNRARRFWEAGVRFSFLDRIVSTIWFTPRTDEAGERVAWLTENVGYSDGL